MIIKPFRVSTIDARIILLSMGNGASCLFLRDINGRHEHKVPVNVLYIFLIQKSSVEKNIITEHQSKLVSYRYNLKTKYLHQASDLGTITNLGLIRWTKRPTT